MEEQEIELKIINMADIQSQKIEWLWCCLLYTSDAADD